MARTHTTEADARNGQAEQLRTPPAVAQNKPVRPVVQPEQSHPMIVVRTSDVTDWLRACGGQARTTMRKLASDLGRSPSGVHDAVRRAVLAGTLISVPGPRGTYLTLREGLS